MGRKKGEIQFRARKHSAAAATAVVLGILGFLLLAVLASISGMSGGMSGIWAGIGGIASLAVAVCGFIMAIFSFSGKDIYYLAPIIGLLINGALIAVCLGIYLVGLSL